MFKIKCKNERPKPGAGISPCNKILFFSKEPIKDMNVVVRCSGCKVYVNIKAVDGNVEFAVVDKPEDIHSMKEVEMKVMRQIFQM